MLRLLLLLLLLFVLLFVEHGSVQPMLSSKRLCVQYMLLHNFNFALVAHVPCYRCCHCLSGLNSAVARLPVRREWATSG